MVVLLVKAKLTVGEILEVDLFALVFTVRDERIYNKITGLAVLLPGDLCVLVVFTESSKTKHEHEKQ